MNMKLINLNFNEGGEKMRLKPVTIKDFKVGQKIAVLILHHGRNKEPELYERTVSRIGRKYVVDDRGTRYCQETYLKEGLVESSECGERAYIFTEMKEAKDYIEKYELMIWFSRTSSAGVKEYSLHQLRKVKEILTS